MTVIADGGAVSIRTVRRDLPHSQVVAIARCGNEIVGVGSIKPVREDYAAGIAVKSGCAFPADTPELGYVSVDPAHQGRGLSHDLAKLLVSHCTGRLFATTDSPKDEENPCGGRIPKGKGMKGERGLLPYLVSSVSEW